MCYIPSTTLDPIINEFILADVDECEFTNKPGSPLVPCGDSGVPNITTSQPAGSSTLSLIRDLSSSTEADPNQTTKVLASAPSSQELAYCRTQAFQSPHGRPTVV